eukprot:1025492-Prymnesium_polylepis.1
MNGSHGDFARVAAAPRSARAATGAPQLNGSRPPARVLRHASDATAADQAAVAAATVAAAAAAVA